MQDKKKSKKAEKGKGKQEQVEEAGAKSYFFTPQAQSLQLSSPAGGSWQEGLKGHRDVQGVW